MKKESQNGQNDTIMKIQVMPIPFAYVLYDFKREKSVKIIKNLRYSAEVLISFEYGVRKEYMPTTLPSVA